MLGIALVILSLVQPRYDENGWPLYRVQQQTKESERRVPAIRPFPGQVIEERNGP